MSKLILRPNVTMELRAPGQASRCWRAHNLIVDAGESLVAQVMTGAAVIVPTHAAIGDGGATPLSTHTALQGTQHQRIVLTRSFQNATFFYEATFTGVTADVTVREVGLFNSPSVGVMFARWLTTEFVLAVGAQFYFKWFSEVARES